jgi:kinesin family protein 5
MTAVEIYAERVRCLLGGGSNLPLKQDTGANAGGVRAEGAAEVQVTANAEGLRTLLAALERALAQRAVAATDMNEASSRSHCVVTLRVLQYGGGGPAASSAGAKLCLVDLAGSERAGRTGAVGQALAEGSAINKSLSALAGVVSALASASAAWSAAASSGVGGAEGGSGEGEQQPQQQPPQQQQQHVPYRDSKLTLLLRDALGGGRSRTALVVCCSPGKRDAAETLSSLRFASRARGVKCMVAAPPTAAAGGGGGVAAELRAEVAALRARLAAAAAAGEASASCKGKGGAALLLPWLLRCASAVVLGAYLAWEGLGVMAQ